MGFLSGRTFESHAPMGEALSFWDLPVVNSLFERHNCQRFTFQRTVGGTCVPFIAGGNLDDLYRLERLRQTRSRGRERQDVRCDHFWGMCNGAAALFFARQWARRLGHVLRKTCFRFLEARFRNARATAVAVLNEECVRNRGVVLDERQASVYLHLDDGVFMSLGAPAGENSLAISAMQRAAGALSALGFGEIQQSTGEELSKVVGYEVCRSPPRLLLPGAKAALMYEAFSWLTAGYLVDIKLLHSFLSMWVWAALLRRELLSIPQALFGFIEKFASARRELVCITRLLPLVFCDLSAPLCPLLFATDAMGSNDVDHGGWGIMASAPAASLMKELFVAGARPGYTACRLDGDTRGKAADSLLKAQVPFSRVPPRLVENRDAWVE